MDKKIKFKKIVGLLFPDLIQTLKKKKTSLKDIEKWDIYYIVNSSGFNADIDYSGVGYKSFKKKCKKIFKFINKNIPELFEDSSTYGTDNGSLSYCAEFTIPKKFLIYSDQKFRKGFPTQYSWSIDNLKNK